MMGPTHHQWMSFGRLTWCRGCIAIRGHEKEFCPWPLEDSECA